MFFWVVEEHAWGVGGEAARNKAESPNKFASFYCRKMPKISPSKYKPPQSFNPKNLPLNRPSKYKPPGSLYLEIAFKYKVKQSKNGKFSSNYKAGPIDFETQISLHK